MARKPKPPVLDLHGDDWEMQLYEIIDDAGVAQMILEINRDMDEDYQRDKYYQRNYNTIQGLFGDEGFDEGGDSPWDEHIPKGELLLAKGNQGFAVVYVNPQQAEGIEAAFLGWDSIVEERQRRGIADHHQFNTPPDYWPLWSGMEGVDGVGKIDGDTDFSEDEEFRYMVIPDVFDHSPQLGVLNWWW
jgi:hypothetical protein